MPREVGTEFSLFEIAKEPFISNWLQSLTQFMLLAEQKVQHAKSEISDMG